MMNVFEKIREELEKCKDLESYKKKERDSMIHKIVMFIGIIILIAVYIGVLIYRIIEHLKGR